MSKSSSPIRSVCVYCGSSPGSNARYVQQATQLGVLLAQANVRLVYGGGDAGLMGAVARGALSGGGAVLGIIPEFLLRLEQSRGAHDLDGMNMVVVPDMHSRKQRMFDEADAFIALPGGIGTLEEIVEIMTWAQLDRHSKPMGLLNTDGFWTPFSALLTAMADAEFLHNPERVELSIAETPEGILGKMGVSSS